MVSQDNQAAYKDFTMEVSTILKATPEAKKSAMISAGDVYQIVAAILPLYIAMGLAYVSVRCWKLFTPEQCSGINKFVAKFSIPLLSFQVISSSNPYKMNLKLVYADFLQKLLAFSVLSAAAKISSKGSLKWVITGLSLTTLPNTLILGIPLLRSMYGDEAAKLLAQIVVLQSLIWYNLLLFLFELNAINEPCLTNSEEPVDLEAPQEIQLREETEDTKVRTSRKAKIVVILLTVGKKLISNPNTHATLIGIIWAIIHFRWGVEMPKIVDKSISILSDGGLGMAMFSLGLFMASGASIIPCGTRKAMIAMTLKFIVGPGLMAISSIAVGVKGTLFKIAIVQAALSQGIVPFVFAKEYNIHPNILSTGVIFGLVVAVPIALAYYFLLAL